MVSVLRSSFQILINENINFCFIKIFCSKIVSPNFKFEYKFDSSHSCFEIAKLYFEFDRSAFKYTISLCIVIQD